MTWKGGKSYQYQDSELRPLTRQPVPSRYTDCATVHQQNLRRASSVTIVTRLQAGRPGLNFRPGQELFVVCRPEPSLPSIKHIPGAPSPAVKLLEHDADHSSQCSPLSPTSYSVMNLVFHKTRWISWPVEVQGYSRLKNSAPWSSWTNRNRMYTLIHIFRL
jgi:hypothetical protein